MIYLAEICQARAGCTYTTFEDESVAMQSGGHVRRFVCIAGHSRYLIDPVQPDTNPFRSLGEGVCVDCGEPMRMTSRIRKRCTLCGYRRDKERHRESKRAKRR